MTRRSSCLAQLDDQDATMVHQPTLAPGLTIKVPNEDLKLRWKATNSKMPKNVRFQLCSSCFAPEPPYDFDGIPKAESCNCLRKAMEANQVTADQVAFTMNPALVYRVKVSEKHQLKLAPLGNIVHAKAEKAPNAMIVPTSFGEHWQVQPWKPDSNFGTRTSHCFKAWAPLRRHCFVFCSCKHLQGKFASEQSITLSLPIFVASHQKTSIILIAFSGPGV